MDAELRRIGERVRAMRERRSLTLHELARRSAVATSTIQKVETSQMVPTVAVLLKIARGLGCRTSDLLQDETDTFEVVHLRAKGRHKLGARSRLQVERLTGDLFDPALEAWRVVVQPGRGSGDGEIRYDGEEWVLCEEGEISFRVGEQEYRLRPGDTLHFKAALPHAWRNEGDVPARFVVVGSLALALRAALHDRVQR